MVAAHRALPDLHQLDPTALKALILSQHEQLLSRDAEIEHLKLMIAKLGRMQFGRKSEKLDRQIEQLELLEWEPGGSSAEVQAESAREPVPGRPAEKRVRKHPGRQALPAELPRVERGVACTAEQCVCGGCGRGTTGVGYGGSGPVDGEPAEDFRGGDKPGKTRCKECEGGGRRAGRRA